MTGKNSTSIHQYPRTFILDAMLAKKGRSLLQGEHHE